jgi:hypothetical protein
MSFSAHGPPKKFSEEDLAKQKRFFELNPAAAAAAAAASKTAVSPQAIRNPEPTKPGQTQDTGRNLVNPNPSKSKKAQKGHQSVVPRKFSEVCSHSYKIKHKTYQINSFFGIDYHCNQCYWNPSNIDCN